VTGGEANDHVITGDGNDEFIAGNGDDTFTAGNGDDTFIGDDGNDSVGGGAGDDRLLGGESNDTLQGGAGNDELIGGNGVDLVSYSYVTGHGVSVDLEDGTAYGGSQDTLESIENAAGSNLDDNLAGDANDNWLSGLDGNDTLDGRGGNDSLDGGADNDTLLGGDGTDTLLGGDGTDTLSGGSGNDWLDFGTGNESFSYQVGDNFGNDTLIGGDGQDTLDLGVGWSSGPEAAGWINYRRADGTIIYTQGWERVVCFTEGTRIVTPNGEASVENLRAGDMVLAMRGGQAGFEALRWVGFLDVAVPRNAAMAAKSAPILIKASALAPGMPARDLRVSPDHAMEIDGHLIPAKHLVNGSSIIQESWCRRVRYFHLELEAHGLLLSEGTWSESYLDDGNRNAFNNAALTGLFLDFEAGRSQGQYDDRACLPVLRQGLKLIEIHGRIALRAEELRQTGKAQKALR
jgi:hypothetical protein